MSFNLTDGQLMANKHRSEEWLQEHGSGRMASGKGRAQASLPFSKDFVWGKIEDDVYRRSINFSGRSEKSVSQGRREVAFHFRAALLLCCLCFEFSSPTSLLKSCKHCICPYREKNVFKF